MADITDDCEFCGADSDRAFVKFHADPNGAQEDMDWADGLPETVYGIVCQACGEPVGFIDPREEEDLPDFDDLPDGTGGSSFKVDDPLE